MSNRLNQIASYVLPGMAVADIGCDHAYIPIRLVKHKISNRVIGCDINSQPLALGAANIDSSLLPAQAQLIELRQGNGLMPLDPDEVDCIIIAGMGGSLLADILRTGKDRLNRVQRLILSPHTEIYKVRRIVNQLGFGIEQEQGLYEEGHYYTIIVADRLPADNKQPASHHWAISNREQEVKAGLEEWCQANQWNPEEVWERYGSKLISAKDQAFRRYLEHTIKKTKAVTEQLESTKATVRLQQLNRELALMEEVRKWLMIR